MTGVAMLGRLLPKPKSARLRGTYVCTEAPARKPWGGAEEGPADMGDRWPITRLYGVSAVWLARDYNMVVVWKTSDM